MTREKKRTLAILAAFAGASLAGTGYAAEQATADQVEVHDLNETVVTAQRREKRDIDTPATMTISRSVQRAHLMVRRGRISALPRGALLCAALTAVRSSW